MPLCDRAFVEGGHCRRGALRTGKLDRPRHLRGEDLSHDGRAVRVDVCCDRNQRSDRKSGTFAVGKGAKNHLIAKGGARQ